MPRISKHKLHNTDAGCTLTVTFEDGREQQWTMDTEAKALSFFDWLSKRDGLVGDDAPTK